MLRRGALLGRGYVKNIGMVDIYHDTDNPKMFICLDKRDNWRFIPRTRVSFRKRVYRDV